MTLLLLVLGACKKEAPVEAPVPAPPVAPAPAPEERGDDALLRALSLRDASPECADLEAMVDDPVASLSRVVAEVSAPPAAPLRAARCLVLDHAAEAADTIDGWMTSPDTEGLARVVAENLDQVPEEQAVRFATDGMKGPHAEVIRPSIAASTRPEVRALAE